MKQETFTDIEYSYRKKKTKREEFLEIMEEIIPWDEWVGVIEPYYPKGKRGRPPMGIEKMLRMYLLQIWFNLSDPATEDAIYDSYAMRKFMGINFLEMDVPDATTLLKFRHLLEEHGLGKRFFDAINRCLERAGHEERIDHRSHADRGLTEQPTIHEGVVARALEKKGIISDRCEINRQIKADNALLRELKATVKKLMQTVKNSVPAIAEAMEKLRGSMLIFSYQLRHIGIGKHNIGRRVKAIKPELERYTGLVQQIKAKSKECKNLLAEKKETPFYQIPKLHDLSRRIAELTEELEELNTEKEMLLRFLDCADDTGISSVKKDIAAMESALKKLEAQEAKYSAELDAALKEYSGLKEQASEFDAGELMEARLSIRGEKERSAVTRVQDAYGEKYDSLMMFDSKRDVANLLHEEAETRSVRERLRKKQQAQTQRQRKPKHHEQER